MAINLKFDTAGNPEPPSIILATKNGNKLGLLNVNADSIELNDKLKVSEISFTLNKYVDGKLNNLWDKVVDFKLVWCKEWDCWFEINVELDEATETVKTVFGTQLGQAELSQIMIYNMEVNTEEDIARDDYKITILYDESDHEASLLHRILKDKASHYSIAYVDPAIARIQRQFSWDGSSICDVLDDIEEEIGCLVVYNSNSTEGGIPNRSISVYDLEQNCNDCGHRGEFTDECPKCGSKNIKYGYGEDTTIFVTADELGSQGIQFVTDVDSVKNCFKLEAGDDLMTATIRNCNPNGSDYIWRFANDIKEDMSDELVTKLENYDSEYKKYYNEHEYKLDEALLTQYNNLVEKYDDFYNTDSTCLNCNNKGKFYDKCPNCNSENLLTGKELQKISTSIVGYSALMNAYYNTIDFALYLESGLMPSVTTSGTTAKEQASLLTTSSLSPVAVSVKEVSSISSTTADSAVLSMAKIIVKSTYKVEILSSSLSTEKKWSGTFKITNYSDDTDTTEVSVNGIEVNNNAETFIKQKIEKALNKENTDDYSISGLFGKEYDKFCTELTKYALKPLQSFYDAADVCISILTEQGAGDETSKANLYKNLYLPYFQKQEAIASEINLRKNELAIIEGVYDETTKTTSGGLQNNLRNCQNIIQEALNFEDYLGEDLWKEFCSFRREDKYSNSNYVSDGLNNAELFKRALEFIDVAENEIYKSSELQHSISTSLNNLLAIDKFKPLVKYFKNGNWIRVRVDDKIYKLRLLEYGINFGSFESIPVEFSDVTKIKNSTTDIKDVLEQASSVASSYDAVTRQAKKGNVAKGTIEQWIDEGLNAASMQIASNDSEEVLLTKSGLLARSYDDITGTYAPEQFKLTHNIMAYTDDNWETVSSALGKHSYNRWDGSGFVGDEGYGLTSKFVTTGYITGSQIIGGEIVSSNYEPKTKGTYINLLKGDFDFAGGKIIYDADTNNVTLKGVTIQWTGDDGVNAPEVKVDNITGLDKYLDQLDNLEKQLDGRTQTWYQSTDPSTAWYTDELKSLHSGDLWHYTGESGVVNGVNRTKNTEWVWQEENGIYQWVKIQISDDVFDTIDGIASIYVTIPENPVVGDLLIPSEDISVGSIQYKAGKVYRYHGSTWKEVDYTDDTEAIKAWNYADEAKKTGDILVNGLGFQKTEISDDYIISPSIAGGYLNITNTDNNSRVIIDPNNLSKNGYIFQVHNGDKISVGIQSDGTSEFSGTITASDFIGGSLLIGDDPEDEHIKNPQYAHIANNGTLTCTNVDILGGTLKIGRYEAKYEDGTPQLDEEGNTIYGWNTWIDENGILKTNESVISGTIYAGAGEIGGCKIEGGLLKVPRANIDGDLTVDTIQSHDYVETGVSDEQILSFVYNDTDDSYSVAQISTTNTNIALLSIPSTYQGSPVTTIADNGFKENKSILKVRIPSNIISLNQHAFYKCSYLESVTFAEESQLTTIGDHAFYDCGGLLSIDIPEKVTTINANAFADCGNLAYVKFGNSIETIGDRAFDECESMISPLVLPNSTTSIGSYAFYNCDGLTQVKIGDSTAKDVVIPDSAIGIADYAFNACDNIVDLEIGNSIKSIGKCAFDSCKKLKHIVIPDSVTSIGEQAFQYCMQSTTDNESNRVIVIGRGVQTVEDDAFDGCNYATDIVYNAIQCDDLENGNGVFDNVGKNSNGVKVTIGADVPRIPAYLFGSAASNTNSPNITSVVFADNSCCTSIGKYAFRYVKTLTSLIIPDSVKSIEEYAFQNCSALQTVKIGGSTETIGNRAFSGCSKLQYIIIPRSVKTIGDYAFNSCSNLTDIYYTGTKQEWNAIDIGSSNSKLTSESTGAYIHYNVSSILAALLENLGFPVVEPCEIPTPKDLSTKDVIIPSECGFRISSNGDYMIDSPKFKVTKDGLISATAGEIGGCVIQNGQLKVPVANISGTITATSIHADNVTGLQGYVEDFAAEYIDAQKITVDTITNSAGTIGFDSTATGSQQALWLGGSGNNAEFSVTANGDVTATDVTFNGTMTLGSSASFEGQYLTHKFDNHYFMSSSRWIHVGASNSANIAIGIPSGTSKGRITTLGMDELEIISPELWIWGDTSLTLQSSDGILSGTWSADECLASGSDRNIKHDIESLPDDYSTIFDNLTPVRFKYNDGTSDRFHTGFIAQDVQQAIETANLTTQDFAAYVKLDDHLALRYEEFIALCVNEIQKLKKRVAELENK